MHLIMYFPLRAHILLMKVSSLYRLYPTRIWVSWHWDTAHPELLLLVVWINVPKQGDNTDTLVWGLLRQSNYTYTQRENKIKSSAWFFLFLKATWNLYSDRHAEGRPTLRGWHWGPDAGRAGQGHRDTATTKPPAASNSGALRLAKAIIQSERGNGTTWKSNRFCCFLFRSQTPVW